MKIKFSKTVLYTPTWRGNDKLPESERMTVLLTVMSFADLLVLMDGFGKKKEDGAIDPAAVIQLAVDLLPKYAEIQNLSDDNGPLTINQITEYPMFMDLAAELLTKLSEVTTPTKEDEKN